MNKRLLWLLLIAFVVANILAAIKINRGYQKMPDSQTKQINTPVDSPTNTIVTKQDIAKIVCPQPLAADNWLVDIEAVQPTKLDFGDYSLSDQERKTISQSYQQGVNLAGYYHLASWSCGQDCQKAAIINIKSGRLIAFGADDDLQATNGWQFSATSSLLTINPASQDQQNPTIYVLIEDQGLRRICYLAQK